MKQLYKVLAGLVLGAFHMIGLAQGVSAAELGVGQTQLARYSVALPLPAPEASNPLAVIATVHFPRAQVQTVGDAVRHLLVRTGYSLSAIDKLSEPARMLLTMPLPESHRRLGPYRVDTMLAVLLGDPWALSIDPMSRSVAFDARSAPSAPLAAATR